MFMNDYQTAARRTAMGNSLDHFVHGLTEEAGEVAGVMKRFHRGDEKYGGKPIVKDGKLTLNDSAKVATADIEASNGVIHVIDTVILPPAK